MPPLRKDVSLGPSMDGDMKNQASNARNSVTAPYSTVVTVLFIAVKTVQSLKITPCVGYSSFKTGGITCITHFRSTANAALSEVGLS